MPKRFWNCIRNLSSCLLFLLGNVSCSHTNKPQEEKREEGVQKHTTKRSIRCTPNGRIEYYNDGDLPCTRTSLFPSKGERLRVRFVVIDKKSEDPYERGYQELLRYKDGKVIEKMKLRKDEDAYWTIVPFVRIRKQEYLADLDGDGNLEFAILPFHPGSAVWMRARIFSLREKIEFWGEGKYRYEGDTFVQLDCLECSKFNFQACKKCR